MIKTKTSKYEILLGQDIYLLDYLALTEFFQNFNREK